jgi:predicted unusual protein kinase regulating ubiquinone biosynthesis (AarF/ABC1/UbiB family)
MLRASSIGASFFRNYLFDTKKDENDINNKCKKLRCLSDTLAKYGGVMSKVSQILSINDENSSVFSECEPFSKKETIKYFKDIYNNSDKKLNIDFNVYKSGSIGQVHRATYNDQEIIFKVQYVGLKNQMNSDLRMIDTMASYIYDFVDVKNALNDVKIKMNEELDYKTEAENQILMKSLWKNSLVTIPEIIPEMCTDNILCMYFEKGVSLKDFMKNSTQEEKNRVGMNIVKFIFKNIYVNGILYSDVHYGNFLVKDNSEICVLDFGCIHKLEDDFLSNIRLLFLTLRSKDIDEFHRLTRILGISTKDISIKSKEYLYSYFYTQNEPWISESFEFTEKWLESAVNVNTELMKEWSLPKNMVYFNKISYGMYHILTKLKLKGNLSELFSSFFQEEPNMCKKV